jgi:hypothetical protein
MRGNGRLKLAARDRNFGKYFENSITNNPSSTCLTPLFPSVTSHSSIKSFRTSRQMVFLTSVQASNACIATTIPSGLVAICVGGTSGIGEYTLKEFARHARQPRIYNIGRSQQASDRIAVECKNLNANAQYTFIQADVSLIRTVDVVCEQIKAKEKAVNILFLSAGTLVSGVSMYLMIMYLIRRRIV